ncbi:hypothetical protein [Streptomyces blattellae]|uniref:hypothetical protein n=1 Tax=Streptomyces blattellae TaxID=2569855 RepID=UPI0012B87980|nr:hypothetical protein [Streptomyces blattellae]
MAAPVKRVAVVVVGAVLAVGGCSSEEGTDSSGAEPSASPVSSRALVVWADGMCESTDGFEALKKESAEGIGDVTDPPEDAIWPVDMAADSYLSDTSSSLDTLVEELDSVRKTGIAAADRLHDRLAEDVGKAAAEVTELSDFMTLYDLSEKEKVDRAERVAGLVEALEMPKPGLSAVVAGESRLQTAHRLAPRCVPPAEPSPSASESTSSSPSPSPATTGPLPEAEDGKNTAACEDGTCEILVTEPVDFVVGDWNLHVTVEDATVTLTNTNASGFVGMMSFGAGGGGGFSTAGGKTTDVNATAVNKDGAVLNFSTK